MSSEKNSPGSEQAELASYRIWDNVERRLWSRARLILLVLVVGIALIAGLGVPMIRSSIEQRVMEQARAMVAEQAEAERVDVAAVRQQFREDTHYARQQFVEGSVETEKRLGAMVAEAEELRGTYTDFAATARELEVTKNKMRMVQQTLKNEEERLQQLRVRFDRELQEFRKESDRLATNTPKVVRSELGRVERIVERELDELRLIIADQMAGKPAMFSTYFDAEDRLGQITGANFGQKAGRVFMRVRAFASGGSNPEAESDSILVAPSFWGDTKIELRLSPRALDEIAEVEAGLSIAADTKLRYGFMVQTAEGQMSHWSGMRADSLIPPERLNAAVEDEAP